MANNVKGPLKEIKNVEHVINHYPEYFNRPIQVGENTTLSKAVKIQILHQWKYDIQLQEVAEDENMHSSKPDILDEIQAVLAALHDPENPDISPPTETGGYS